MTAPPPSNNPPPSMTVPVPDPVPVITLDPTRALVYRTPVQDQPGAADAKAAAVLTVVGLMLTVVARFSGTLADAVHGAGPLRAVTVVTLGGFGLCALGAVVQAFRTISPRFPKAPPSLAFFQEIAKLPRDEYVRRVIELTPEQAVEHMLTYNHTLCTIVVEKYRQLRLAIVWFRVAFACWIVLGAALVGAAL